ncbi:hypothetical protein VC83_07723 [Pseudogymnoascus destructans]|uniref:Uncharacterized protein n=2 Tax=Pseudogymnoascus destructans TaxID=655981 RepID=L8FXJ0_PSED2|nr:uncharacterized protein VC83_07723 [Pseudogymnoascus destructans]ELR05218.1 hypothetical protein GMDG_01656 [Pseudogymnoascus destructans 20631-21]OAF55610.1 hypothetical protein VC83_07723 [Pseudogymnoascus destructans]
MSAPRPGPQPAKLQSKQQQHLDTLQNLINTILIETGKALRSANMKGAKTISHDNDRLQMYMPKAITSFHGALDELESDIVRAKAVIARDLREVRRREEELRNPVAKPNEGVAVDMGMETVDDAQPGMATRDGGLLEQPAHIKMEEAPDALGQGGDQLVKPEPSGTAVQAGDLTKQEALDTLDLFEEQPKEDLVQTSEKPQDEVKQSIEQPEASAADVQQVDKLQDAPTKELGPLDTLDTNDDMPYESLFGPKSAHDDHPDLNFDDFDFGTDNAAGGENQDQEYSMANDGHIDLSTFGEACDQPFGNDDGSSMLQGLESYANQVPEEGADINMLDTANSGGNAGGDGEIINLDGEDGVGMSGADLDLAMGIGGNETNFDDLLDSLDFEGGDETTGLENQKFDDAYFGIGDS